MFQELIAELPEVLDLPDRQSATPAMLLDTAAGLHRLEQVISAYKLAFAGALVAHYRDNPVPTPDGLPNLDPWRAAEAEFGAALTISQSAASHLLTLGFALETRLPKIWDAAARGDLDIASAKIIVEATAQVASELIRKVEDRIVDRAITPAAPITAKRLRGVVDAIISEVDADGVRDRRKHAETKRKVWISNGADGMANLHGRLPVQDATFLTGKLGEMAKQVCADDPRSFQARRADALTALCHGQSQLACQCQRPECPFPGGPSGDPRKPLVHVITSEDTLNGGKAPGWLDGFGIIDAAKVRDLAQVSDLRPLKNPLISQPGAELRYRPSRSTADFVRAAHGFCQWPGCNRPAWESDVDHRESFNHRDPTHGGKTRADQLGPICRLHHVVKTFGGWRFETNADGHVTLFSPLGRRYRPPAFGPLKLLSIFPTEAVSPAQAPGPPPPSQSSRSRTREAQRNYRIKSDRTRRHIKRITEYNDLMSALTKRRDRHTE